MGASTPCATFLSGVTVIDASYTHSPALLVGHAHGWGSNEVGQLGDGTTTHRSTPVRVCAVGASSTPTDAANDTDAAACTVLTGLIIFC